MALDWLTETLALHFTQPKKKNSIISSQSEKEWDVSFRRRARERKSGISGPLCFYVSTVLRDGVNEDSHGRERKQTSGHLPWYMGPLPRLVFILFFILSYLWKEHEIEWNITPELLWPRSRALASSRLDSRNKHHWRHGKTVNKCGSCFSQNLSWIRPRQLSCSASLGRQVIKPQRRPQANVLGVTS